MHTLLFGGTFDPIHHGHLLTARAALEHLQADRLLLIPAAINPHKRQAGSASPEHRLAMCRLAAQSDPRFAVSDMELHRPGPSFTFDTVQALRQNDPSEFTLLIGADQLPKLHTWHRIADLLAAVHIAVLGRPGTPLDLSPFMKHLPTADHSRITLLPTPLLEISATDIRARVASGHSIVWMVPETIASHIHEHHLYA